MADFNINLNKGQTLNFQFDTPMNLGWTGQIPAGLTVTEGGLAISGTVTDVAGIYTAEFTYGTAITDQHTKDCVFTITDPTALGVPVISCSGATPTSGGGTLTVPAGNFVFQFSTTNVDTSGQGWNFITPSGITATLVSGMNVPNGSFSANLGPGTYLLPASYSNHAYSGGPIQTANYLLTIVVMPAQPIITLASQASLSSFTGKAVAAQFSVQTNAGTVVWSATALPPGCTLNASTGLISGTPTASGTFATVVTATNSTGSTDFPAAFTIAASTPAPVITCTGATASANSDTLTKTAGNIALQFLGSNGGASWAASLPSGLSINSSYGSVSGTLAAGVYDLVVSCSNTPYSGGSTQTSQYFLELTVADAIPVITLTDGSVLNVTAGSQVSAQFAVQAYAGTVAWSATGLPAGCVLNPSTGQVSGTPSYTGTSQAVITATNDAGSATYNATFLVTAANSGGTPTVPAYPFLIADPTLTDLQIDVRTGAITSSRTVSFKQFQKARFALVFLDAGAPIAPPDVANVKMGIRPEDQYEADYLFPLASPTLVAAADENPAYLLVEIPISGDDLVKEFKARLDAATASLAVMTDVIWHTEGIPCASQTLNFTILPAVTF